MVWLVIGRELGRLNAAREVAAQYTLKRDALAYAREMISKKILRDVAVLKQTSADKL